MNDAWDVLTDERGVLLTKRQVKKEIERCEAKGYTVIPPSDCDNTDELGNCKGHEEIPSQPEAEGWQYRFEKKVQQWQHTMGHDIPYYVYLDIKSFIRSERHALLSTLKDKMDKLIQGEITIYKGEKFVTCSTREQKVNNQALSNVLSLIQEMEEHDS